MFEFSAPFARWSLSVSKHTGSDAGSFCSGNGKLVCVDVSCSGWTCVAYYEVYSRRKRKQFPKATREAKRTSARLLDKVVGG